MAKAKPSGPEQVVEFMQQLNHPLKTAMETLRDIMLHANKDITEHIK